MKDIRFDILEQNEVGAVAICNQCDQLHIEIGAFTSLVSKENFNEICIHMVDKSRFASDITVKTPTSEKILIPVGCNNYLSLTPLEYFKVTELFEMAQHMLGTRKFLQL